MKLRNVLPFLYFSISVISLGIYLLSQKSQTSPSSLSQTVEKQAEKNLFLQMQSVEQFSRQLKNEVLADGLKGWEIKTHSFPYSFFIFKNGEIQSWSDYKFVPDYSQLKGKEQWIFRDFPQGEYLVHREQVRIKQNRYELFVLLTLQEKYKLRNFYLKSSFNENIFSIQPVNLTDQQLDTGKNIFRNGLFLFNLQIDCNGNPCYTGYFWFNLLSLIFLWLGLGLFAYHFIHQLQKKSNYDLAFLSELGFWTSLRAWMLYFNFPYAVYPYDLFHPKWYASSLLSPSLGDLLLNIIVAGILIFSLLKHYRKFILIRRLNLQAGGKTFFVRMAWAFLSYLVLHLYINLLSSIFLHSRLNLDISREVDFSLYGLLGIAIFIFSSLFYIFTNHIFVRLFLHAAHPRNSLGNFYSYLAATALYLPLAFWSGLLYLLIILIHTICFFISHLLQLPKQLFRFNYFTSMYLFLGAVTCAMIGAFVVLEFGQKKLINEKRAFGVKLLPENDNLMQYYLSEAVSQIKKDSSLYLLLNDTTKNALTERVLTKHLNNFSDKYQVQVMAFNADPGLAPERKQEDEQNWTGLVDKYKKVYYETENEDIYFINKPGANLLKHYICFLDLKTGKQISAHLLIDIRQKIAGPTNVYPKLLLDDNFTPYRDSRNYSYAVYDGDQLVYNLGTVNYEKDFELWFFSNTRLFEKGILDKNYHHLALEGGFKKRVVISSEHFGWYGIFSNFSFFFLILVLSVSLLYFIILLFNGYSWQNIRFATKIQFYLNLAFFLPLFSVSIATLNILNGDYQKELNESLVRKAENIKINLLPGLERYLDGKEGKEEFGKNIAQIAQFSETDINLFTSRGKLILSSQPLIYESTGLLSSFINPMPFHTIIYERNKEVITDESIGELKFKSVYMPLKSFQSGKTIGILSIPFFDSKFELNRKFSGILSVILNLFASIFIFFAVLSYFASNVLTVPLRLITQKLRKANFTNYNESLDWNSRDEIGLFVQEYNKMLTKLEKNQEALARSQKESAWREMAKQVAHEIKNPLTPMKLTLQHMQIKLQSQSEKVKSLFERSFETLLTQVETLSDIAVSFSSFAQMPIPESERFDISPVLKESQELYNNEDIELEANIQEGEFYVRGDKKLMGRIFTNLIKNAIEAVEDGKKPKISINLKSKVEGLITITIRDNGKGIPETIKDKIFIPNFSTKTTGSGIGLAVAKRGIEHAGGRIWFETETKMGSSFFIELPLID